MSKQAGLLLKYCFISACFLLGITGHPGMTSLMAQRQLETFQNYTTQDGIPSRETYDILQDKEGYIWIATDQGVARFDGETFRTYTTDDGLPDNVVFDLYEDEEGRIWFQSYTCQLSYFEHDAIHPYRYNHLIREYITVGIWASFFINKEGTFYMGFLNQLALSITAEGDLTLLSEGIVTEGNHFHLTEDAEYAFQVPAEVPGPNVERNILVRLGKFKTWEILTFPRNSGSRRAFYYAKYGKDKMALTQNSLLLLFEEDRYYKHVFPSHLITIVKEAEDKIWIGNQNGGASLYSIDQGQITLLQTVLPGISVSDIYKDREGGYWFSSLSNGIFYLPALPLPNLLKDADPEHSVVTAMATDQESQLLVGTSNLGVYAFEKGRMTHRLSAAGEANPGVNIEQIHYQRKEDRYLLNGNNVYAFQRESGLSTVSLELIFPFQNMSWLPPNQAWASADWNLFFLEDVMHQPPITYNRGPNRWNTLYALDETGCWVGNQEGIFWFDREKDTLTQVSHPSGKLDYRVEVLHLFKEGWVAVGTQGAGLLLWDHGETLRSIGTEQGLASNLIQTVDVDKEGRIWVGTAEGLCRIELSENDTLVSSYSREDGLPTNQIEQLVCVGDSVYIGTEYGLSVLPNSSLPKKRVPPPVFIRGIRIKGEETPIQPHYDLSHTQDILQIDFKAITFNASDRLTYMYRLRGLDEQWLRTKEEEIQFTTLPAGSYTFEIKSIIGDVVSASPIASFSFKVNPPFWKKSWVIITGNLILIALIALGFQSRLKRVEERNRLQQEMLKSRGMALAAQMNPHFIYNALNSIQGFILRSEIRQANEYLTQFARLIRMVLHHSTQVYIPLQEEMNALRYYLQLEKMRFGDTFDFSIEVPAEIMERNPRVPSLLFQPFVENSIKHGFAKLERKGHIQVNISMEGDNLICHITDNGIGREAARLAKGDAPPSKGLSLTKRRLELEGQLHNRVSSFRIEDLFDPAKRPTGTRVHFTIPLSSTQNPKTA